MARRPENVTQLVDRLHWTVRGGRATFASVESGWRGTVTALREPTGPGRFHVAIVDRTGVTRYASEAPTLAEAVKRAEHGVIARNALRLASAR
jgi:hypothetical protein